MIEETLRTVGLIKKREKKGQETPCVCISLERIPTPPKFDREIERRLPVDSFESSSIKGEGTRRTFYFIRMYKKCVLFDKEQHWLH